MLGISPISYSHYETCRNMPTKDTAEKISKILNKPLNYLFPDWLKIFTEKWKRAEKETLVTLKHTPLDTPEVLALTAPVDLEKKANDMVLKKTLSKILDELSPRERKILEMRFGLEDDIPHLLEEIGREFDVTRERIRSIEVKAFEKIKKIAKTKNIDLKKLLYE